MPDVYLSPIEVRVLGCLIEKEATTPEYYPLSLNSLTAACSQKSSRDPVMQLSDDDIRDAIDHLRGLHLLWELDTAGGRVAKYDHNIKAAWKLTPQESAVLCVLMLRGPQTGGEIKGRTGRLHEFASIEEVEATLTALAQKETGAFVCKMERLPGHKECRYCHLLSGEVKTASSATVVTSDGTNSLEPAIASPTFLTSSQRIAALEGDVQMLKDQISEIKAAFEGFKKQFE